MRKKSKAIVKKNKSLKIKRGKMGISVILLTAIVVFALFMAGGSPSIRSLQNQSPTKYTAIVPTGKEGTRNNLQLKTIEFKTADADCGNNVLKGSPEPNIVFAMSPDPGGSIGAGGQIKIWYNDEWPLTLGAGNVTPNTTSPQHITNPNVGDQSQKDVNGFPFFPALFISDITTDPNNKSGDAESGGKPYPPNEVYGTWKPLGNIGSITTSENGLNLGPGADPFPQNSNIKLPGDQRRGREMQYGSLIIWNVDSLGLTKDHTYRAEFIIHDGDQEGDIGQGCTTITY